MSQEFSTTKAFVTGWPITHSKSPALHGFWLDQLGINGSYEPLAVAPENFKIFIDEFVQQGFAGGNVTIPHKEAAFQLVEKTDEIANLLGAVNTLWNEDGVVQGTNTDAYGFTANLDDNASGWREGTTAIVLGAGGASRAVIQAILDVGYSNVHIVNRTQSRAHALADRFGERCNPHKWEALDELMSDTNFLVNTTSLGMAGGGDAPIINVEPLPAKAIVTDIVYSPLITPLLASAQARGLKTVDGLGMLLHQAVPGFEKWFGARPEVTEKLRQYVLGASNSQGTQT